MTILKEAIEEAVMPCPTCEDPLPENDDRFLPYCSEDCLLEAKP